MMKIDETNKNSPEKFNDLLGCLNLVVGTDERFEGSIWK